MTPNQSGLDKRNLEKHLTKKTMAVDLVCFVSHLGNLAVVCLVVVLF